MPLTAVTLTGIKEKTYYKARDLYQYSPVAIIDGDNKTLYPPKPGENAEFGYFRMSLEEQLTLFPEYTDTKPAIAQKPAPAPAPTPLTDKKVSELGANNPEHVLFLIREQIAAVDKRTKDDEAEHKARSLKNARDIDTLYKLVEKIANGGFVSINDISGKPAHTPKSKSTAATNNISGKSATIPKTNTNSASNLANGSVGLMNIGKSCYINATLQALFRVPSIREAIIKKSSNATPLTCNADLDDHQKKQLVKKALQDVLYSPTIELDLNLTALRQAAFDLHTFDSDPRKKDKGLTDMQDAGEFMNCILGCLEDVNFSTVERFTSPSSSNIIPNQWENLDQKSCLSVNLDDSGSSQSFSKILENHFSPKHNTNPYKRQDGIVITDYESYNQLTHAPDHLIIQLMRFKFENHTLKINTPVEFPEDGLVDLSYTLAFGGSASYQIIAYINHEGQSAKTGHYTAHVKDENNIWQLCDDPYVDTCVLNNNSKGYTSNAPYIIVLKKIEVLI